MMGYVNGHTIFPGDYVLVCQYLTIGMRCRQSSNAYTQIFDHGDIMFAMVVDVSVGDEI